MTKTKTKPRQYIRRQLTETQKKREIVLILLGVDKRSIAEAVGVSEQLVFNVFTDKHRSVDVERKIVAYLDDKAHEAGAWELSKLATLGFVDVIDMAGMGWPEPETP